MKSPASFDAGLSALFFFRSAYKPGSVLLRCRAAIIYLGQALPPVSSCLEGSATDCAGFPRPFCGIAPGRVYTARFVSESPVGSYPAFSPLHFCRSFLLHFP